MNLKDHIIRQMLFSANAFGPGDREKGVSDHISKELKEISEAEDKPREWVDVFLLSLDGFWRAVVAANPELTRREVAEIICEIVDEKQGKNERREWPNRRTADPNGAIQHIRGIED